MKNRLLPIALVLVFSMQPAWAHPEAHVHSEWIKREFQQLKQSIGRLQRRIEQLERNRNGVPSVANTGAGVKIDEVCSASRPKLCEKSCPAGWKITNAKCTGRGNIGKTYHRDGAVLCYCFNENDPGCRVERISASCFRP